MGAPNLSTEGTCSGLELGSIGQVRAMLLSFGETLESLYLRGFFQNTGRSPAHCCSHLQVTCVVLENSQRGGQKRIVRFWGGGKRTIKQPLQNQFWRPQKVGFVWSVPVSSKENNIA